MNRKSIIILGISTFLLVLLANWLVFMVVPDERVMGAVQRIFYFHVASAFACYAAFAIVFVSALLFLARKDRSSDLVCESAGEVGFVFCSMTLASGMIWGKSAWNTWFSWEEPRLVTFLVLWLIFLSFTLLRNFGEPGKVSNHSAILGILGALSVPLVYFSIKLLPKSAQLHPEVIEHGGLKDPSYWWAFGVSSVAMLLLMTFLIIFRYKIASARERVRDYLCYGSEQESIQVVGILKHVGERYGA